MTEIPKNCVIWINSVCRDIIDQDWNERIMQSEDNDNLPERTEYNTGDDRT